MSVVKNRYGKKKLKRIYKPKNRRLMEKNSSFCPVPCDKPIPDIIGDKDIDGEDEEPIPAETETIPPSYDPDPEEELIPVAELDNARYPKYRFKKK